jgi:hypothetical protein
MSVELISAIFTGLTGLLAGLAAVLAQRSRRVTEDSRAVRRGYRQLQKRFLAAMDHIFVLEQLVPAGRRPPRPEILEADEDDDGPTAQPARANA